MLPGKVRQFGLLTTHWYFVHPDQEELMTAGRICSRDVDTAEPDESAQKAAHKMHARVVGTLVIINAKREPIGMITDRDLAVRVIAAGRDPSQTVVRDIMTPHPGTVYADATLEAALLCMRSNKCRRIPVVDGAGRLEGLLSLDDILKRLTEEFQLISGLVRDESPKSLAHSL